MSIPPKLQRGILPATANIKRTQVSTPTATETTTTVASNPPTKPLLSEFWSNTTPVVYEALSGMPNNKYITGMMPSGAGARAIGNTQVDQMGIPTFKGSGTEMAVKSSIDEIIDKLDRDNVDPKAAYMQIKEIVSPENRGKLLSKTSIFNSPEWNDVIGKKETGGETTHENMMRSISNKYTELKNARDARLKAGSLQSTNAPTNTQTLPSETEVKETLKSVAPSAKIRVIKKG